MQESHLNFKQMTINHFVKKKKNFQMHESYCVAAVTPDFSQKRLFLYISKGTDI